MKKLFFSLMLLIGVIVITSCNREATLEPIGAKDNANSTLLTTISQFNDSLLNVRAASRGYIQPGAWRRGQVIIADCTGAMNGGKAGAWAGSVFGPEGAVAGGFLGGLLGGACASYVAWETLPRRRSSQSSNMIDTARERTICAYATMLEEEKNISEYTPKEIKVKYPIINENIVLMGAMHNIILDKLINNGEKKFYENHLTSTQLEIINSKEFIDSFNEVMENISNDILNGNITTSKGNDISTRLMNMFYDILVEYPEKLSDVEFIINKYIDAVKSSSELSEDEKDLIYTGLSVAASSSEFWNENYK